MEGDYLNVVKTLKSPLVNNDRSSFLVSHVRRVGNFDVQSLAKLTLFQIAIEILFGVRKSLFALLFFCCRNRFGSCLNELFL
jgi:hypothetical protein